MQRPRVSFVIATYNRREVLLQTLAQAYSCGLGRSEFEVLLVDNASTDGTAEAIHDRFPSVTLLRQSSNRGPCAKNVALARAQGEFVVFLDDDSYPQPFSIARMIEHFAIDPQLGAAVFTIHLPDGSQECSAYPDVCIGCGTGFRRRALVGVGGLPEDFFMAAEEYDLSLRLLDAGWKISRFDDLHVCHQKSPVSRYPARIARLDARNNVMLAMRYFPEPWRMRYVAAWLRRYHFMSIASGNRAAFRVGAVEGLLRGIVGIVGEYRPISARAFEQFARIDLTCNRLHVLSKTMRLRRILLIDLGKNYLAYLEAARQCGLEVMAIADARLGGHGFEVDGIPILSDPEAQQCDYEAAVISNLSPVHAAQALARWRRLDQRPTLDLFELDKTNSHRALAA